ncbi:hypothetical protein M409DRAFT_64229 [Zasmidium cellare ATCC 36951]|uniref:U3 small nucleolar RNA-associated protein 6 N-terminal domain-containing protein n=1 Tax=Zasmidium cellare ATCC 36951 TaxID=1080233 RepID=A0A6A6CWE6_ZASCE|nr:uncharacterized protein M409DRAFT_64229 [Zasmidium cellare ATCC 36951]KAF2170520.1 hypothetical protein M409DRAFT_64229 [Zasmidium cellare ATCC 36951]
MAAASDRARFYLEQYVPELQESEQKGIFTRDEISAITKKRSDFEHTLNARGSTTADYARYATYEMNLDSLRKKRCKRLGVKSTTFSGQRTIFFILDRATKKFPSDMGLWMQYINYCKKEKANKKLSKVFTAVLRLHPRDWSLWVLAAKYYAEAQGDMSTARSFLQRGLRFCKDEKKLYLEYAKLEMVYLAKLSARRKILGLDGSREEKQEDDENMIALPTITAEDIDPDAGKGIEEVDENALKRLETAPAFSGAIPIAIFDAAMKQFHQNAPEVAEAFFDLISSFDNVPSTTTILQHILDFLHSAWPSSPEVVVCDAKLQFFAIDSQSPEFPAALSKALASVKTGLDKASKKDRLRLAERAIFLLLPYLDTASEGSAAVDEDIVKVLEASVKRYLRIAAEAKPKPGRKVGPAAMIEQALKNGDEMQASLLVGFASDLGLR